MQRSTLIAVVVFGVLLVAAGWVLTRKPERGIQRVNFSGLQASLIDRVVVSGGHAMEAKKDGNLWRLANGREADGDLLQNLLASTLRISSSDVLAQDANHSLDYDVDSAKGEHVQLFSLGTQMADFVVGKSMTGGATAVRSGDLVFRVANLSPVAFAHSPAEWLQRRMFAEKMDEVKRLNVRLAGAEPYNLFKAEKGWELAQDANAQAAAVEAGSEFRFDAGAGQALVAAVVGARAQDILDADPGIGVTQLGPEADSLTFYLRDNAIAEQGGDKGVSRTLRLGATREDKSVYAQVEGRKEVVVLPAYAATALRKQRTDLRDLTIMLGFDVNQVEAITLDSGKRAVTLSKDSKDNTWHLPRGEKTPAGFVLDPGKVMRRIQTVAHARALGLAKGQVAKAAGLSPPQGSISINLGGGNTFTVGFGAKATEQDNAVYVLGTDRKVYYIATYLRDTLLGGLDTFNKDAQQADPLSQLDPKTLAGLPPDVRASLEQQIAAKKREQEMLRTINQGQAAHP